LLATLHSKYFTDTALSQTTWRGVAFLIAPLGFYFYFAAQPRILFFIFIFRKAESPAFRLGSGLERDFVLWFGFIGVGYGNLDFD
jgi:hypothetical protein